MSLATLKMIEGLIEEVEDESYMESSEWGQCVVPYTLVSCKLGKIRQHLEESLKRDGFTLLEKEE